MTIIKKAAPGKGDGMTFVLSDATKDRYGDVIEAGGWDLRNFQQNPIALFGHSSDFPIGIWKNLRVEGGKLLGDLRLAARGTSQRLDELISLVEQGILRAVSVGFKPIDSEPLEGGGRRYKRQELLETSLVSVPANPSAVAIAKSMHISDATLEMAFDEHVTAGRGEVGDSGEHAVHRATSAQTNPESTRRSALPSGDSTMKTLSQRIEDAQDDIVKARDTLTELNKSEAMDLDAINELADQIEEKEARLGALKRSEQLLAVKASGEARQATSVPARARRPLSLPAKSGKPGDMIIRAAVVNGIASHMHQDPLDVLERAYGENEGLALIIKAAVSPATTTTDGWAAELVNEAMSDFLETLRPESVYPSLSEAGGGRLNFGPNSGSIKIPARAPTPSIGGSFIGEGAAIPVRRLALTSVSLTPKKMGVITTFTREMAKYSVVALESMLRQEIVSDTAITLDSVLLGTGAGDADTPAGLLNGVSALTATAGGGYAAILGDIKKLRAPFDAANAGNGLMMLMNPAQAEGLNLTPGADGTLGWADSIIARYRVAVSTAIPSGRIIMVRAADFASATNDVPEFELSNDATVHMEDTTPLAIGSDGAPNTVAAPVRSFFQTGVSGLRMIMDVSWAMRRANMVQYIDGATW